MGITYSLTIIHQFCVIHKFDRDKNKASTTNFISSAIQPPVKKNDNILIEIHCQIELGLTVNEIKITQAWTDHWTQDLINQVQGYFYFWVEIVK